MQAQVLRVFVDDQDRFGNPLGIVVEPERLAPDECRGIAAALGFSETAFLGPEGEVRFYSPKGGVRFAGHAAVGLAWFLNREHGTVADIELDDFRIEVWFEEGLPWIAAPLRVTPAWWHERMDDPDDVAALAGPPAPEQDAAQLWAWIDQAAGTVRARTFAARLGQGEDEATGSASMRLAAALGAELTITHGRGSTVFARPHRPGVAALGGRVVADGIQSV